MSRIGNQPQLSSPRTLLRVAETLLDTPEGLAKIPEEIQSELYLTHREFDQEKPDSELPPEVFKQRRKAGIPEVTAEDIKEWKRSRRLSDLILATMIACPAIDPSEQRKQVREVDVVEAIAHADDPGITKELILQEIDILRKERRITATLESVGEPENNELGYKLRFGSHFDATTQKEIASLTLDDLIAVEQVEQVKLAS